MFRSLLVPATIVCGILALLAIFTPWWVYPGTNEYWTLQLSAWPPSYCVPAGDNVRLTGRRGGRGGLEYGSDAFVARSLRRFQWRIVPPADSFWVSKHGRSPITDWQGSGTVDDAGLFTGTREGLVAVEAHEGTKRAVAVFTVIPPLALDVVPARPSVRTGGYVDLEVRASFPDGTTPPAYPPPHLRAYREASGLSVVNQAVSGRSRVYAPWSALISVREPGSDTLILTYMTRRILIPVSGGGPGGAEPTPALIDSVKRARFPLVNYQVVDSLPEPLRWRMLSIRRRCLGIVEGFNFR